MKNIVIILFCMTFLTGCKTASDTENEINVSSETMEDEGNEIYEMLKEYMWDEVVDTFSPYYELIDYRITNYKEDTDEKLTEALFNYKVIYKNFDKDPDTVEYIRKAKEIESLGCHIFAIKDMAGLLKPYAAKKLFTELKKELHIPLHLHTHDTTGNGVSTVLMAAEAGVDIVDLAIESMSTITSQPSMNAVVYALKGTDRDTGLVPDELEELSRYYEDVRKIYAGFESKMKTPSTEIYKYEIPGGQYSNLRFQVKEMGSADDFDQIKELYRQSNELFGNIVKVTPSSKVIGDFAIFMQKNGLTKDNIFEKGKDLSYPESAVEYFKGMVGRPDGGFPDDISKIVLKDQKPIEGRAGELLEPADFDKMGQELMEKFNFDHVNIRNILSYALYPKVYDDYCTHLQHYNDVSRLDSHVYFYGLKKGEETVLRIGEGKAIIIKYIEMTEPNEEGYRTLTFEINGIMREVTILDKSLEVKSDRKLKAEKNNPAHLGSPIPGTVSKIFVKEGDKVEKNTVIMTVEAMKMETSVLSKVAGVVDEIYVHEGGAVNQEELLVSFKVDEEQK